MKVALLCLLLACATGPAEQSAGEAEALDPAAGVRAGLIQAVSVWQQGDTGAAAAQVRSTAAEDLAPLLPELRAFDPQRSLELEYSFGLLAAHAARTGPEASFSQEADALATQVEQVLAEAKAAREAAAAPSTTGQGGASAQSSAGSNGAKSP